MSDQSRASDISVDQWGITDGYHDVRGEWHPTSDETRAALRAAMGEPQQGRPMWFVEHGTAHHLWNTNELLLEDGTSVGAIDDLPVDLPIGYHDLVPLDGGPTTRLVVHPTTCPELPSTWGVAVQVYALWSDRSWGIGDLADLRVLAQRIMAAGGGALLTSPLHQPAPSFPQEPSPYYPSSRRAWNPLLLSITGPPPTRLRCASPAAGTTSDLIARDDVWIAKRAVLEAEFEAAQDAGTVSDARPDDVAVWNAHCDILQADWRIWPDELPSLDDDAYLATRAAFHQWLQDRFAAELAEVTATGIDLIGDLAVGFSPSGADAHHFRDELALDMRIGAPPDMFNPAGQEWGIPPFVPWRLRAALYEPFIDTVRACLRGVRGLRIDHVMGLFRQYWVPDGGSPSDGAYVRFPADELLAILCLEATRAGAFVVGEDLGTVEPAVRTALAGRRIAGTRVLWFEDDAPALWPAESLATVTTHDLPTVTEVCQRVSPPGGPDDDLRRRLFAAAL
ncbi:MAG: 4-alpha-glucanotransferase, partial [Ilumatobacteraceae bacterium]